MATENIQSVLERNHIHYGTIDHPTAYTAQETAAAAHIPGKEVLKPVMIKLDGRLTMAVVPAMAHVNLRRLAEIVGARSAEIAHESDFANLFIESERGAMPPMGNLYGIPVYMDSSLEGNDVVAFNAGSHNRLIEISFRDYKNFVQPHICNFIF